MTFTQKYVNLFLGARTRFLGEHHTYSVVHWRRGDQIGYRCAHGKDYSVNCGSAENFIAKVISIVYVATNEDREDDIKSLKAAGFYLFRDLHMEISPLDAFVVELQLMIDATTFFYWGNSSVDLVADSARLQQQKLVFQP